MNQTNRSAMASLAPFRVRAGWVLSQLIDAVTHYDHRTVSMSFFLWDIQALSEDLDPEFMSQGEKRLLELACEQANLSMVNYLLRERLITPTRFNVWRFILEGPMDIACALVSHGFNIDQPFSPYPCSVLGCFLHRPNIVMRLLGVGANPNMVTSCGCGDIPSLAGQRASIEVVEMLYLAGAQFSRSNALHRAVQAAEYDNDRFAIMDFLLGNELVDINQLEYGYKAEGPNKWPGSGTALHCAVKTASLKSVKYLLSWKADLIVENRMGWTPLYMARRYGLKDIEKVLKDAEDTLRRDACKNG